MKGICIYPNKGRDVSALQELARTLTNINITSDHTEKDKDQNSTGKNKTNKDHTRTRASHEKEGGDKVNIEISHGNSENNHAFPLPSMPERRPREAPEPSTIVHVH